MAQEAVNTLIKTEETAKDQEKEGKQGTSASLECAICFGSCIHPVKLPCTHIFCYLCLKGVVNWNKNCPMCRQEIPVDFLERPQLVEIDTVKLPGTDDKYRWFYEGDNGWWQYDPESNLKLEIAFKEGKRTCEFSISGLHYIVDFEFMKQMRKDDPSRSRRIERNFHNICKKGVAGLTGFTKPCIYY